MYEEGAIATYSLLGTEEARLARARITAAYEVLGDPVRRREYDVTLGIAPPAAPVLPFPLSPPLAPASPAVTAVPEPSPATPSPPSLPEPLSGAALRRLRESRGVDLREIALATKIGVRFLEYIEADRHDMLPAPVYLRGFLMEYARMIGLDPRRTAEVYMERLPRKA
jgi:flagellar biosynthesis protein FlhG